MKETRQSRARVRRALRDGTLRGAPLADRVGYQIGRVVRAALAFTVCAAFLFLFWRGWFPDLRLPGADLRRVAAAAVLTALLAYKISARVRIAERRRTPRREAISDAEVGLLLLTTVYLLLAFSGGVTSSIYPLVYAVVSFLVTFHRLAVGLPLAAAAIGFEAVLSFGPAASPEAAAAFPGHVGFIAVFALLNVVFLHAEVARQRRERRRRLEGEVAAMREEARDFRLISTALSAESRVRTRAEEQEKLSQGSIQTIHQQLYYNLDLLRSALELQTCALLWLDESGERLKVKELCTESTQVAEGAIGAGEGVLGAILKEMRPFVMESPRLTLLPYYSGSATVGAFIGVPVVEGRAARGVLIGDRADERPFDDAALALMASAADQVVRVVQSERVFQAVERSKDEHERFYRASAELNRALTLDEVYTAAIAGARGVCEFDLAAIATYDARRGSHTIRSVVGEVAEHLLGTTHKDPSSIASMAAKNKLALPAGGEWRERDVPVFSHPMRIKDYESLLVLPLLVKDEVIGTFTVGAKRAGAFPSDRREMLGVIANQVAISMQNARMYEVVEEQATTDGLTGLVNHRTFQERFSSMLGRADRRSFAVSMLLTDIDHFKKVNDTYGHPTGDEVLRRVAVILKASARKIDIVARYGGEEFAIVLEGTDRAGALQLAERIRQEVAQQSFASPQGAFQVTLSIGVACYPEDARDKTEIIARADQSLYAAKHGGRNRTVCYADIDRGKLKVAAK
jgi:two-component system, cell cycle response regulator